MTERSNFIFRTSLFSVVGSSLAPLCGAHGFLVQDSFSSSYRYQQPLHSFSTSYSYSELQPICGKGKTMVLHIPVHVEYK